ncbi:MAG TPA: FAD-dependent oxidoreductase [Candidatus Acidoferrum sp.]|nr:FAD-dependent oxidoreductase [Candidatus Acidoferrum sp.]
MPLEQQEQQPKLKLFGTLGSPAAYAIRDFLHRSDVPFEWVEIRNNQHAREIGVDHIHDPRLPVCVFSDGTRMERPTIRQIIEKLGWFRTPSCTEYDLAIYGAGPAGLSAAVYGASEGLKTVVVERWAIGGQAASSPKIENYLGFPAGISGAELAERAREQACRFGAEILLAREGVRGEFQAGKRIGYLADGTKIVARTAICATGIEYRRLGLPNEDRFIGAGVYYGAGASEASMCGDEHVFIVGGGNSAGQAALHFARFARIVSMVVRADNLKSTLSTYLIDRIRSAPKVEVLTNTEVTNLEGDELLRSITLVNRKTGEEKSFQTRWLFVCIGGSPHTDWAVEAGVVRDEAGYLVTGPDLHFEGQASNGGWPLDRSPYYLETNVPGLFAAGDVRHGSVKRCASAVGEGAMAVTFAHRYLSNG